MKIVEQSLNLALKMHAFAVGNVMKKIDKQIERLRWLSALFATIIFYKNDQNKYTVVMSANLKRLKTK